MNEESFEFKHNGDVLFRVSKHRPFQYIGRIESDGRLALIEDHRNEVLAAACIAALKVQLHIKDFEPAYGWMTEHYVLADMKETNV